MYGMVEIQKFFDREDPRIFVNVQEPLEKNMS